jgi:hypothetical protein
LRLIAPLRLLPLRLRLDPKQLRRAPWLELKLQLLLLLLLVLAVTNSCCWC